jgi:hypothetical protein
MRRTLRRIGLAVLTASALLTAHKAIAVDIFVVLTGYGAKETCSCVFVVEQTDEYCRTFGQASADYPVELTIDHAAKTVTAKLTLSRTAHYTEGAGCTLDGL